MENTKILNNQIQLKSLTWLRDSHDLYDYEADSYITEEQNISSSCKILRDKDHIFTILQSEIQSNTNSNYDHLLTIKFKSSEISNSQFEIIPAEKCEISGYNPKKVFRVVQFLPNHKYNIQENDLIKLGRTKFKVLHLLSKESLSSQNDIKYLIHGKFYTNKSTIPISDMQSLQCRICLCEGGSELDPLIKTCLCKGSIEYIHFSCLQNWYNFTIDNYIKTSKNYFYLKLLHCEMCKQPFPIVIKRNNALLNVYQIPKEILKSRPLLILENIIGNTPASYHIMNVENSITFGRGHQCNIRLPDVSVSRHHATINYENGFFSIQDERSKFGTLVSIKQPLLVKNSEEIFLQVGRSILKVQIIDNFGQIQ